MQTKYSMLARPLALAIGIALCGTGATVADAAPRKKAKIVRPAPRQMVRAPAMSAGVQRPAAEVVLSEGRGQLITLPTSISDIFIAADNIVDVQVRSERQLYMYGKSAGETSFYATDGAGKVVYSANIRVGKNFSSIDQMLKLAMPESDIQAMPLNGMVLLTGTIQTPEDAAEAERLAKAYTGGGEVVSRLRVATPMQVSLQVRIAEVSRNFTRNLGLNWKNQTTVSNNARLNITTGRDPGTINGVNPPAFSFTQGGEYSTIGIGLPNFLGGGNVLGALDAGETEGFVTTLASPTLTSLTGKQAEFLVGGEVPIPLSTVNQGVITQSVIFRSYGTKLQFTPTVLADGRISLKVSPEVSELDYSNAITLQGTNTPIPGTTTRKVDTTVELGSGQSFVIGGLMRAANSNTVSRMPGAGNIPILGSMFRSTAYKRGETELLIVVTPYIVRPVSANQIVLPTDGYQAPNEAQRLLMGDMYKGSSAKRPVPTMSAPTTVPAAPSFGQQTPALQSPAKPDAVAPGFGN